MDTGNATQQKLYDTILARDTKYDDMFFFAVTSTGIYCRPSCPARRPLKKNCRFFASASEAEKFGFRACKRCRPEQPRTSETILQFYKTEPTDEVFDMATARVANGLEVGERQFRRLVKSSVGKTPVQLFRQQRLEYARHLLQHTDLAIITVAFKAEFNSVRQFNHAFKQKYGENPTRQRKKKEKEK